MRIPRLYTPMDLSVGASPTLDADQTHYLSRVLRLGTGHPLVLFNGNGGEYSAHIIAINAKQVQIQIERWDDLSRESPIQLCLAIALSKGDRFDWVLQKATELGVSRIQPLRTERVEVRLNAERLAKKQAHWQGVARSACEQSGRTQVPEIAAPTNLSAWLKESTQAELRLLLNPEQGTSLKNLKPSTAVDLLIGPEGGLSTEEIDAATEAGYQSLKIGPRILRTETAPLAVLAAIQSHWGDW